MSVTSLIPVDPIPGKIYDYYEAEKASRRAYVEKYVFLNSKYSLITNPQDPRLYALNKKIKNPQGFEIMELAKTLVGLHIIEDGAGLAAPQIGANIRMCVIKLGNNTNVVLMNPRIVGVKDYTDDNVEWQEEGCLSQPGVRGEVARLREFEFIASTFTEPNEKRYEAKGFFARVLQHEMDHLNRKLFTDLDGTLVRKMRTVRKGQEQTIKDNADAAEFGFVEPEV